MADKGASDLHLKPMRPPLLRLHGKLFPMEAEPLQPEDIEGMVFPILSSRQKERLDEILAVDIGYGIHGLARFRGNIFRQRGTVAASFRRIPYDIMTVDDLDLPPVLLDFCDLPMGLVLITGPTGSGKSTTLAALISNIARTRPVHILTIEDPMEFLFTDSMAAISQREVGTDTVSFTEALRNGVRQDPDVMMVGEMRDVETMTHRHHGGRDRSPGVLHPAHQQRHPDHRPHPRLLPVDPAQAGAGPAGAGPQRAWCR